MSSDFLDRISQLSQKRLALLALELHDKLEAAGRRPRDPIAVIGMGCRFPGGSGSPEAFWELLRDGRDAIGPVPGDRWDIDHYFDPDPDAPAKMSVRHGGFLDRIDGFDATFFGISPREAQTMDPQQRLMLEVAWEALEDAGVSPEGLAGSASGVFLGICNNDHFHRVIERGTDAIDAYLASGNAHSVASGRVAYFLGLQGPALSIDTACSSSLVALHLACLSLRHRESRLALAGGVNVMCAPETTIALTKAHMLAPDGRCKTFDAAADGFSRGEGCGVLVLKRLEDAEADGDRVLAVIRGTAANQDGRSGGLTVPSGPAQEAVIRAALADAGLEPSDIDYVEAHGTGTTLGDPIEVRALAGALGPGRKADQPLRIGSVKTNIGHLESAAGIAGVIKVVLAMQHERIPPHLHFRKPSPHIAWGDYPIRVEAEGFRWPRRETPRRAGVSSFGFSGTNAHVILEEAPTPVGEIVSAPRSVHCLPLSARSTEALQRRARDIAAVLAAGRLSLADVARTLGVGRAHQSERLAVVTDSAHTACAALDAYVRGETHPALQVWTAEPGQPREIAFLFTGQGSQAPRMGQQLYATYPVFRDVVDRCATLLGSDAFGRTLTSVLYGGPADEELIHETAWSQPALFAVEYAMTELWRSWGITPSAVIGHSLGEYVAACVAGVFTFEEGLALVADRGRLMQALPAGGTMAAVFAPLADVEDALAPFGARLAIAAINADDSVVVSGERAAIESLLADLASRHIEGRHLFVSVAAHSPLVEPALDEMERIASRVTMRAPRIPVAWNVTGGTLRPAAPDARYWRRHLREPVRFADGIRWLHEQGYSHFLEVGPHPTLMALAQRTLPVTGSCLVASMRRGFDERTQLTEALAALYVQGAAIDWHGVWRGAGARTVSLPTYPFERRSFWIQPSAAARRSAPRSMSSANALAGTRLSTAVPTFETELHAEWPPYLAEHRVYGEPLVAAPVLLALVQAGAAQIDAPRTVVDFVVSAPLVVGGEGRVVQVHFPQEPDGTRSFALHSRQADDDWVLHATGRLVPTDALMVGADRRPLAQIEAALGDVAPCDDYYDRLRELGIELGAAFRTIRDARRHGTEALARIGLDAPPSTDYSGWTHPGLFDGALQTIGLVLPASGDSADPFLLSGIERIELDGPLPASFLCHARLRTPLGAPVRAAEWRADLTLRREDGTVIGVITGAVVRRASSDTLRRAVGHAGTEGLCYRIAWREADAVGPASARLMPPDDFVTALRSRLDALAAEHGVSVYDELLPLLDRLSREHAQVALGVLGFDDTPGRRFTADAEARRHGVVPRHQRLFARLLQILASERFLIARKGSEYEVACRFSGENPDQDYAAALVQFAGTEGELRMLRRCGGALSRVLRGEQDPLQLLFPDGSFAEARQLYVESPYARTYNSVLVDALSAAIARLPSGSRLRVLEVGGGTAGTTTYVMSQLAGVRLDYTFTDLSPMFLERAAEQFGTMSSFDTALLDIERDPASQGFRPADYDVVIAANVLHAAADLGKAVRHAKSLLRPGGLLFLLEGVAPERWVDLTFGLTEGWWRFTDTDLRPDYPLIGREQWSRLLADTGFEDVHTLPNTKGARGALAQQALILARVPIVSRTWTLVGGPEGLVGQLRGQLETRGDRVTVRPAAASDQLPEADELVYLGAIQAAGNYESIEAVRTAERLAVHDPIRCLADLIRTPKSGRVWIVTRGAMGVDGPPSLDARGQRPVWGVGRVFGLEHPARWGGAIDLDPDAAEVDLASTLIAAIDIDDGEDQTAWRAGGRYACRLQHAPEPPSPDITFHADATYLVTGGFGGLGAVVAKWMVKRGARHVALVGRTSDAAAPGIREIEALGGRVLALQGDVADEAAMNEVLRRISADGPPVRGIIHAAAAMSGTPIANLTSPQVSAMLRPKVDGTLLLERLAVRDGMDFLVLFSSTTALLGASGLAHYAAANLFLDATAEATEVPTGCRTLAVNWGTWDLMRLASSDDRRTFREAGMEPMSADDALRVLGRLMGSGERRAIVAAVDWAVLKPMHEARRARPFLAELGGAPPGRTGTKATQLPSTTTIPSLLATLDGVPANRRRDVISTFVEGEVASVLGLDADTRVSETTGLFNLGMDSLMSVELKRRLERGVGHTLPSTLTFNYPTVLALAGFLESRLTAVSSTKTAAQESHSPAVVLVVNDGANLDELSEDELEARLAARLEQLQ